MASGGLVVLAWTAAGLSAQASPPATSHAHAEHTAAASSTTRWGRWAVALHASLTLDARWDPPPRGRNELFATNMTGVSLIRALGNGSLQVSMMTSIEPVLGPGGYPLLLQTGETADGSNPLVDRQHPHDLLMGLGASYDVPVARWLSGSVYVAPVGSPALGPETYMSRASAGGNPTVPIGHHFLDATHISHGVVTAGLHTRWATLEASVFNGREPDRHRWMPDRPALNSWSARLRVMPLPSWTVQASVGRLEEPERLHPGIDLQRVTVSVSHTRVTPSTSWATTVAWGRNTWQEAVVTFPASPTPAPLGGGTAAGGTLEVRPDFHITGYPHDHESIVFFPELEHAAWLAETAWSGFGLRLYGRYEQARKNELFPAVDPRHRNLYDVDKLELGLLRSVRLGRGWSAGIGGSVSLHRLDPGLRSTYGDSPRSYMLYVRLDLDP